MSTKLTLNIDENIVINAKSYAKENKVSLSELIENYLHSLASKNSRKRDVSPLVESLTGVVDLPKKDYKKSYTNYLSKKYS